MPTYSYFYFEKTMISKSLVVRLKLLTALWLASTLFSITFTLVLSWRLEGGAAAINDTGGLRKQTYHLVLLIAKETSQRTIDEKFHEFEKTLQTLKKGDPLRPLFLPNDANVRQLLADVRQTWQQQINPIFRLHIKNTAHSIVKKSTRSSIKLKRSPVR